MAVDISEYRARVGLFNHRPPRKVKKSKIKTNSNSYFVPIHIQIFFQIITTVLNHSQVNITGSISQNNILHPRACHIFTKVIMVICLLYLPFLVLLAGDIHKNPGPILPCNDNLSSYFLNARSIKTINDAQHKMREFK